MQFVPLSFLLFLFFLVSSKNVIVNGSLVIFFVSVEHERMVKRKKNGTDRGSAKDINRR